MQSRPERHTWIKLAKQMRSRLTAMRHQLAQYPEVAPGLPYTRALIMEQLKKTGWQQVILTHSDSLCFEWQTGLAGPQLLFCANAYGTARMEQEADIKQSHVLGFSHRVCNHDAEITTLLGLARLVHRLHQHLTGTIRLLFIADDILNLGAYHELNQKVFHGMRYATNFEFSNRFYHERIYYKYEFSKPRIDQLDISYRDHTAQHTVLMAAKIITQLPNLLRQSLGELTPIAVKFNKIHASDARNIHPNTIDISGHIYTYDKDLTYATIDIINGLIQQQMLGQDALIQTKPYLPALYNDTSWLNQLLPILEQVIPGENLVETPIPTLENNYFAVISETMACAQLTFGTRQTTDLHDGKLPVFKDSSMCLALTAALGIIFRYVNKEPNILSGRFDGGHQTS